MRQKRQPSSRMADSRMLSLHSGVGRGFARREPPGRGHSRGRPQQAGHGFLAARAAAHRPATPQGHAHGPGCSHDARLRKDEGAVPLIHKILQQGHHKDGLARGSKACSKQSSKRLLRGAQCRIAGLTFFCSCISFHTVQTRDIPHNSSSRLFTWPASRQPHQHAAHTRASTDWLQPRAAPTQAGPPVVCTSLSSFCSSSVLAHRFQSSSP